MADEPPRTPRRRHTHAQQHRTQTRPLEDTLVLLNLEARAIRLFGDAQEDAAGDEQPCAEEELVSVF